MTSSASNRQCTVAQTVVFIGVGLHNGRRTAVTVRPAVEDSGIRFVNREARRGPPLRASWQHVVNTSMCTTLGNVTGTRVSTVEHLLAAFRGCGIDNALVEVDGGEVPVLDGSARAFADMLLDARLRQTRTRRVIEVRRPMGIRDKDRFVLVTPSPRPRFTADIDFPNPVIGRQRRTVELTPRSFRDDVASARTFGFADEIDRLHAAGLALGGSEHNAILLDESTVVSPGGLRFPDEFVRHKVLDLIGDVALSGFAVLGHFYGYRPGHLVNTALVHRLMTTPGAWTLRDAGDETGVKHDPLVTLLGQHPTPLNPWKIADALLGGSEGEGDEPVRAGRIG